MASESSTLRDGELELFLGVSRSVMARARIETSGGCAFSAGPDEQPSGPDTRTLAAAIVTLTELGDQASARAGCQALLGLQSSTGAWTERPNERQSRLGGEDATALALWALMTYVRSSGDQQLAEQARSRVDEAVRYTCAATLNPYLYLVETNSSIHGPGVSEGYELWNNCAHAAAFALCHRVYGGQRHRRLALLIRRAIGQLMIAEGRFLRRLDPRGYPDPRPDICLIAPWYFKLWAASERMVVNSAELIERALWNVEIGGYVRFLPFSAAERIGLPGPSPLFSAWMAQFHYDMGNKDRAEAIIRWLFDHSVEGQLPELLIPGSAASRFLPEQRRLIAESEQSATQDGAGLRRMRSRLDAIDEASELCEVIPGGTPLIWAHLETLRALYRGGYLDSWQLDPAAVRLAGESQPP